MILALRTDNPRAELYLLDSSGETLDKEIWTAGHQLSVQLLAKLTELLERNEKSFSDLVGVALYAGPGSFTGLRIGFTVGNSVAYAEQIPAVAAGGDDWLQQATLSLKNASPGNYPVPTYGKDANITKPKK